MYVVSYRVYKHQQLHIYATGRGACCLTRVYTFTVDTFPGRLAQSRLHAPLELFH